MSAAYETYDKNTSLRPTEATILSIHHMKAGRMLRRLLTSLVFCTPLLIHTAKAADRPNILWISCEDISAHLGCYGDLDATTPTLDQLATEGVRYTHAFTCHGVCAPCRTGIITGMYPIALGANHMRSKVTLPDHVKCFPESLRAAGYFCTNNSKTDYNVHWNQSDVWDESSVTAHWKNRADDDQPFFAVFNLTMTHESKIWPENWARIVETLPESERHDPAKVNVPELYPDTPKVRGAIARLHDIISVMDKRVAELLKELDEAGIADDTIVIFWSDHGDGFARSKRWIYDSGTRVPMIVRIPEKHRVMSQGKPGTVTDQLVNLIDLGPTVLNLAGVPVPDHMHGRAFLGAHLPAPRQYIFGARDRIDERFDMVRSARDRRFRYVRNYMPWLPVLQHVHYSERSVVRQEMRRLLASGELPQRLQHLFSPTRPDQEFYDLENDPYELRNLADDPEYVDDFARLKAACDDWQDTVKDAHMMPESELEHEGKQLPSRWHVFNSADGSARWKQIKMELGIPLSTRRADPDDPVVKFWQISRVGGKPEREVELLAALKHNSPAVRIAAARGLSLVNRRKHNDSVRDTLHALLKHPSEFVRHAALLTIDETPGLAAQSLDAIRAMDPSNNYIERVAQHALGQDE